MLKNIIFLNFKDILEITLISLFVYFFLNWLRQDSQKNLIFYAYIYILMFFGSYYYDLQIVYNLIIITTPFIIIFFIIVHQETLQKNFILLTKIKEPNINIGNWLTDFLSGILYSLNMGHEIIFVIEMENSLNSFIKAQYKLNADIKRDVFDIILDKQVDSLNSFIWCNNHGKLIALNSLWSFEIDNIWTEQLQKEQKWKSDAVFITKKTDALIIKSNCEGRNFDFISQGKIVEKISGNQLLLILEKYITSKQKNSLKNSLIGEPYKDKAKNKENSRIL